MSSVQHSTAHYKDVPSWELSDSFWERIKPLLPKRKSRWRGRGKDVRLLAATLDGVVVDRPEPSSAAPQHLCLDKAYAGEPTQTADADCGRRARLQGACPGQGECKE